jgi:hypothetical protein
MTNRTPPPDFVAEAQSAFAANDRAHLILQSLEAAGLPWSDAGKALTDSLLARLAPVKTAYRAVLFTGHRIDVPGRSAPRFPAAEEATARDAIRDLLRRQLQKGSVTGMGGAANGGDILFLESCRELGIPFYMLLALPSSQFISKSVATPQGDWVARFESLARDSEPVVLAQSKTMPEWLAAKQDYNFWARNNLWMISFALALNPEHFLLAALWDGGTGDGPGGTENMVRTARQHGAHLIHLDTRELFRLNSAIRSAKP